MLPGVESADDGRTGVSGAAHGELVHGAVADAATYLGKKRGFEIFSRENEPLPI